MTAKTVAILGLKVPVKIVNLLVNGLLALLGALRLNTPNRIVVALSPVFFTLSGVLLALAARYFPFIGHRLTRGELTGLLITGAVLGSTKLLAWLHGWQQHEKRQGGLTRTLLASPVKQSAVELHVHTAPAPEIVQNDPPASEPEPEAQEAPVEAHDAPEQPQEGEDEVPLHPGGVPTEIHEVGT